MKRLNGNQKFRPTMESKGFLDSIDNKKIFPRRVDAYVFAAAYAISQDLDISKFQFGDKRSELISVDRLDPQVQLALEASIHVLLKRAGRSEPSDEHELLELITKFAETGIKALRTRWLEKTRTQIQDDIMHIIKSQKDTI